MKLTNSFLWWVALASLVLDPLTKASAQTVANPSFETPNVGPLGNYYSFELDPAAATWIFTGNAGIAANGSGFVYYRPAGTSDGNQFAFLQEYQGTGGAMAQTISGFANGTYIFTFIASQRDTAGRDNTANQTVAVSVDGVPAGTFTPADTNWYPFATTPITLAAGTHTVSFATVVTTGDDTILIDGVGVTIVAANPVLSWATPATITYGTALSSNQLDAIANTPGSFSYSPTSGTVLNAGTSILSVVFTPTDTVDYNSATDSVSLVVLPAPPPSNSLFTVTPIYSFYNGAGFSASSLLAGADGRLYGTLAEGGTNGGGAVFSITTNGYFIWYYFLNGTNGNYPEDLIQGFDGNLYGINDSGGTNDDGAVFSITTNGNLNWSFSFNGADGSFPHSLIQGMDGNLYGDTYEGGTAGLGTAFSVTTKGALNWSFSFVGTNGSYPNPNVIQGSDGKLYGTTYEGGNTNDGSSLNGSGTAFSLFTNGQMNWSSSFPYFYEGFNGSLDAPIQGRDGNLYGATASPYANYSLTTQGGFNWELGFPSYENQYIQYSDARLIQGSEGNLYGLVVSTLRGVDAVTSATTNGSVLWASPLPSGSEGPDYDGFLIQGIGGNVFGETESGGTFNHGRLFAVSTNGNPLWYFAFDGTNGAFPFGGLIEAADGNLYGIAESGGPENHDILFRLSGSNGPAFLVFPLTGETVAAGAPAQLTVVAGGTTPLFYQWQLDGTNLFDNAAFSGSHSTNLTIALPGFVTSGSYQVVVSNAYGSITSGVAILTGLPAPVNDNFSNAIPLGDQTLFGLSFNATLEAGEPYLGGTNTVWWSWTAPNSGVACVDMNGSQGQFIDINGQGQFAVEVFTGNTVSNLTLLTNNLRQVPDGPYGYAQDLFPIATFNAVAGVTYYMQVAGAYGDNSPSNYIAISVQPEGMSISGLQTNLQEDGSTAFSATVKVDNSGLSPETIEIDLVARAGYSATQSAYDGGVSLPSDQLLVSYYITNLPPGTQTNIIVSGVCPAPSPFDAQNFGVGWDIFVNFNGGYQDSVFLFSGYWPDVSGYEGPGGGVVRVDPAPIISTANPLQVVSASINGPASVSANSKANYSGTVYLSNGSTGTSDNFTNTVWTVSPTSSFTISSNGVFSAGSVTSNTPVTITAYYFFAGTEYPISTTVTVLGPLNLGAVGRLSSNRISFILNGQPQTKYVLQTATNLSVPTTWTSVVTNTNGVSGQSSFTNTILSNMPALFYRAVQLP
jgi:hypothetical protein